jgi:hypothetical protein
MVGTSIVLLRGGGTHTARNTKVTEEGTPVATLDPPAPPLDPGGAPAVIGGGEKKPAEAPAKEPPKMIDGKPTDLPAAPKLADEDQGAAEGTKQKPKALAKDDSPKLEEKEKDGDGFADIAGADNKSGKKGGATAPPAAAAPAPIGGAAADKSVETKNDATKKTAGTGGVAGPAATTTAAPNQPTTTTANAASYDDAMTAYKASKWADAAKGFDAAAASGVKVSSSLLYSARSYRAAGSCAQAVPRYQKLVNGYPASAEAPHGAIEGGQCAKALSDVTTARALFEKAKTYPVTQKQAEAELAALNNPPQSSPPAKAKAAKPPPAVDSNY